MSLSSAPAPVTTPTGAPLPLVALPQVELLTVNSKELVHTFVTPQSNTEDTVILVRVLRANINFTTDGQFHSILDAALLHVGDGEAGMTSKDA